VSRPLVVCVGDPVRGDDGVGHAVAGAVREAAPEVRVVELAGDAGGLLDCWSGENVVVVVDALRSDDPPGTLRVLDVSAADPVPAGPATSSHGLGVAEAVALGRVLGRLPGRLVLVGVVGGCFDVGAGLTPAVGGAVPSAVEAVLAAARAG
jgi:hydrogenase maturation protease